LPMVLKVKLDESHVAEVRVRYSWKPEICDSCQSFGHCAVSCPGLVVPFSGRTPLPRPPVRMWVRKIAVSPDHLSVAPLAPDIVPPIVDPPAALLDCVAPSGSVTLSLPASDSPPSSLEVDPSASASDIISWFSDERAWVHSPSDMRYSPERDVFYAFISDSGDESRYLLYHIVGEGLCLITDGELGEENKSKFYDVTWDRKFLYSPGSVGYDPLLATLFARYSHVIGPSAVDGRHYSSSPEED
jgi:hypothetical protein